MYKIRDFPYLAVRDQVFFPGSSCRLDVSRASSQEALRAALSSQGKTIAIFSTHSAAAETGLDDLHPVGVLATAREPVEENVFEAEVTARVRLRDITSHPHPIAQVELLEPPLQDNSGLEEELGQEVRSLAQRIFARAGENGRKAFDLLEQMDQDQALPLVYFLGTVLAFEPAEGLAVLEAATLVEAQRALLAAGRKLLQATTGGRRGESAVKSIVWPFHENQEGDPEEGVEQLRVLVEELELPDDLLERVLPELEKLDRFDPVLFEHQDTVGRLEGLLSYPWHVLAEKPFEAARVEAALDKAVLGHDQVKGVLLDLLSARTRGPATSTPLLVLAGSPGLGRGTLVRSLARALDRPLERILLPARDGAELLRGSPRSTPGSQPGAIYEAAVRAGVMDPVLLLHAECPLEEAAARVLAQLTHPEESRRFSDSYLGLPLDTSRMLVVLAVRSADMVPQLLRREAVVLELEGYGPAEKRRLVVDHLWPAALRRCGLKRNHAVLEEGLLEWLVEERTCESGVQELAKLLDQMARRLARRRPRRAARLSLSLSDGKEWLGCALPRLRRGKAVGVVSHVVLSSSEAEVREIAALPGHPDQERSSSSDSATPAAEATMLARAVGLRETEGSATTEGTTDRYLMLAGAWPAPEDGVAAFPAALALRSARENLPVRRDLAVFGKLGAGGEVAPLGNGRERALAAERHGYRILLLPSWEAARLSESLPSEVLERLRLIGVDTFEQAARLALRPGRNPGHQAA
jgi:ATP-dependent Lon protease